jgi:hypothetical protein
LQAREERGAAVRQREALAADKEQLQQQLQGLQEQLHQVQQELAASSAAAAAAVDGVTGSPGACSEVSCGRLSFSSQHPCRRRCGCWQVIACAMKHA